MVAYSFQPQFALPIATKTKRQTLRNDRKRHARAAEEIQLYTGLRTRHARKLGIASCVSVQPIRIDFAKSTVWSPATNRWWTRAIELDDFAELDGFAGWAALADFWRIHHPAMRDAWEGVRIFWADTFTPVERVDA